MNRAMAGLAAVCLSTVPVFSVAQAGEPVVVELFTSQGCSSCPPADAWLGELADRPGVIALSMHVDYWDYLGWRDTFASPETTGRQYAYRDAVGAHMVWTPQVVVHGRPGAPGDDRDDFEAAMAAARTAPAPVSISVVETPGMVHAMLEPGPVPAGTTVWVLLYTGAAAVEIERGENDGRAITYRNVVRGLTRIGLWDGTAPLDVPLPQPGPGEGCVILLQAGEGGPIIAAARIEG